MAERCTYEGPYSSQNKKLRAWYCQNICDSSDPPSLRSPSNGFINGEYGSVTSDMDEISALSVKFRSDVSSRLHSLSVSQAPFKFISPEKRLDIPVVDIDSDDDCEGVTEISTYKSNCKLSTPNLENLSSVNAEQNIVDRGMLCSDFENDGNSTTNLQRDGLNVLPGNMEEDTKGGRPEVVMNTVSQEDTVSTVSVLENAFKGNIGIQAELLEGRYKSVAKDDAHEDMWSDMDIALGSSPASAPDHVAAKENEVQTCEHSVALKDYLGLYCKSCGLILKSIDRIFEYQWNKASPSPKASFFGSHYFLSSMGTYETLKSELLFNPPELEPDLNQGDLPIHPRHAKQMKGHQLEGFSFLHNNLMTDKPGGCILAHAPGSGKTMLIISFIQSFLTKYPNARPLIVLPKGIIETWRKEFQKWKIEEMPLYSMYKAESRLCQLEILKKWRDEKSILLLGYMQFSSIICDMNANKLTTACQEILLQVPGLLILDEGHTPRNEDTDILHSLGRVQTPRKVVLSGTLFQNHVKEVFNIVKLVRPNFFKLGTSRALVRQLSSRIKMSLGGKRSTKVRTDNSFSDLVEEALQSDDLKMKATVIHELRKLTGDMLHYYKGDLLEELPGLLDFTVILHLTSAQKVAVHNIQMEKVKGGKFKESWIESVISMHPSLKEIPQSVGDLRTVSGERIIDRVIRQIDVNDGVKTKFFLNILSLAESTGEKILVYSQYLRPLVFLKRLVIHKKRWREGEELFMISGDSKPPDRARAEELFNESSNAKVLFGSVKACGEGISLVGASRVIFLDVHLNPSVTRQAVGRAFRPGQKKKVYVYRLVAADSQEELDHVTSFRKELISKVWFEWTEHCGPQAFQMTEIDVSDSEDTFLENPLVRDDLKALYRR